MRVLLDMNLRITPQENSFWWNEFNYSSISEIISPCWGGYSTKQASPNSTSLNPWVSPIDRLNISSHQTAPGHSSLSHNKSQLSSANCWWAYFFFKILSCLHLLKNKWLTWNAWNFLGRALQTDPTPKGPRSCPGASKTIRWWTDPTWSPKVVRGEITLQLCWNDSMVDWMRSAMIRYEEFQTLVVQ